MIINKGKKMFFFSVIIENRVDIINEHFTFNLFCNVCRSLFERNKLQFAILLCTRIMIDSGKIQFNEWTHFLSGGTPLKVFMLFISSNYCRIYNFEKSV